MSILEVDSEGFDEGRDACGPRGEVWSFDPSFRTAVEMRWDSGPMGGLDRCVGINAPAALFSRRGQGADYNRHDIVVVLVAQTVTSGGDTNISVVYARRVT